MIYFNEFHEMEPLGENGVLHTAYYLHLQFITPPYHMSVDPRPAIEHALTYTAGDHLSHDNYTGIVCMSNTFGFDFHKRSFARSWHRRWHPRDIFFYNYLKGGLWRVLSIFLMPFMLTFFIDGILTTLNSGLATNGIPNTTGKLLYWLRCQTMIASGSLLFKIYFKLLTLILKRKNQTYADIFEIYFTNRVDGNKEHPIIALARSIYGGSN